jgi:2-polyprenyl-3-methyl-5-hydroxy-6-metoxy-1,4-benzoquinol methylase
VSKASSPATVVQVRCDLCSSEVGAEAVVLVKDGHEIARCSNCGLIFRRDLPETADLPRLYADDYFRAQSKEAKGIGYLDYLADEESHRRNARRRLRLLEKMQRSGRLLDVGCAAGFFVAEAARQGWTASGIDLAAGPTAWGRDQLGVTLETGQFLDLRSEGQLDAITMWDYLEHTLRPRAEIERASSLLRKGGILALSTGDADSRVAKLSGRRWHLLTPRHHNFYFTPRTLGRYLEESGFAVVMTKYFWSFYSIAYLGHKLQTMSEKRAVKRGADLLGNEAFRHVGVPVNLWDIMTVVARKL